MRFYYKYQRLKAAEVNSVFFVKNHKEYTKKLFEETAEILDLNCLQ
jgi:hypothetical protein